MSKKMKEMDKKAESLEAELKREMAEIYLSLKDPALDEARKAGLFGKLGEIERVIQENILAVKR